ncbi:unnamed protein product, partial [Cuscuta europaea]
MLQANRVHYLEGKQFKNLNISSRATNGLICLFNRRGDVKICNPSTRQHISLPRAVASVDPIYTCYILGFDPISKNYKVLKLQMSFDHWDNDYKRQYCVLTLEVDKSWRQISNALLRYPDASVHIDGIIYLISSINRQEICTFNVGDENIRSVPFPGIDVEKCTIPTLWG